MVYELGFNFPPMDFPPGNLPFPPEKVSGITLDDFNNSCPFPIFKMLTTAVPHLSSKNFRSSALDIRQINYLVCLNIKLFCKQTEFSTGAPSLILTHAIKTSSVIGLCTNKRRFTKGSPFLLY